MNDWWDDLPPSTYPLARHLAGRGSSWTVPIERRCELVIFVGVDWAEAHHDLYVADEAGRCLGKARVVEGVEGVARSHDLVGAHVEQPGDVVVGIGTDRGLFVGSLVAAGYEAYAINPLSVSRCRGRHGTSGAKPDPGDAKVLAELVRTDRHNHRPVAEVQSALRAGQLAAPGAVAEAMGAAVRSQVAVLSTMTAEVARLEAQLAPSFEAHPDAWVARSLPGLGTVLGARVPSESRDGPDRYASPKPRKNYAGTSPITRASGTKTTVPARHVRNLHLGNAAHLWAYSALTTPPPPGARASYDAQKARGASHNQALRPSGTASWAYCTAASPTASPTTGRSPGATGPGRSPRRLDALKPGCQRRGEQAGRLAAGYPHFGWRQPRQRLVKGRPVTRARPPACAGPLTSLLLTQDLTT